MILFVFNLFSYISGSQVAGGTVDNEHTAKEFVWIAGIHFQVLIVDAGIET